jgi:hypothetical protein
MDKGLVRKRLSTRRSSVTAPGRPNASWPATVVVWAAYEAPGCRPGLRHDANRQWSLFRWVDGRTQAAVEPLASSARSRTRTSRCLTPPSSSSG